MSGFPPPTTPPVQPPSRPPVQPSTPPATGRGIPRPVALVLLAVAALAIVGALFVLNRPDACQRSFELGDYLQAHGDDISWGEFNAKMEELGELNDQCRILQDEQGVTGK